MGRAPRGALVATAFVLASWVSTVPAAGPSENLPWVVQPDQARQEALESKRLWVMYFYSPSCPHCQALTGEGFSDPRVAALTGSYVFQAAEWGTMPSMYRMFSVNRYPTVIVADSFGREVVRIDGNPGSDRLARLLQRVARDRKLLNEIGVRLESKGNDPHANADLARWYAGVGMNSYAAIQWVRALRLGGNNLPEAEYRQWTREAEAARDAALEHARAREGEGS